MNDWLKTIFSSKNIFGISPLCQYTLIVGLYIASVVLGYQEYMTEGTIQGYVGYYPSIFFVPIYEEVLFRGIILGALLNKKNIWSAIIISSILFGIWHLKNIGYVDVEATITQVLYTMCIIGPILGYVTVKTKSIIPAIIVHYIHNVFVAYLI